MLVNRRGFTLTELLLVVLIIGILAAIAIPKFTDARKKAFVSTILSDLKNFATYQEIYYAQYFRYAADEEQVGFIPSSGVEITTLEATEVGWAAYATHRGLAPDVGCAVFLGRATPPSSHGAPTEPGAVACNVTF